jgi:hypothetical protein
MKSVVLKVLAVVVILILCLVGFIRLSYVYGPWKDAAVSTAPSAADILNKAALLYEQCQSYQDDGKMSSWFISIPLSFRTWIDFKTVFNRPNQFRFEYRESGLDDKSCVVWRQGSEVQTWWWIHDKVEKTDDLSCAIAGATGVSGGTSHNIPSLLLPKEIKGHKLTQSTDAYRISDRAYLGTPCYRIQTVRYNKVEKNEDKASQPSGNKTTYWINQQTFAILKIEEVTSFPWFMVRAQTTYSPKFNQPLSPDLFKFGR